MENQNEHKLRREVANAQFSHVLYLSHCQFPTVPRLIFQQSHEYLSSIKHLDLSFNNITIIPDALSSLVNLKELWLSNNPIKSLPTVLGSSLHKLEVLDIRNTQITFLPPSFAGMHKLYELDWRNTPLEVELRDNYNIETNDLHSLMKLLQSMFTRKELESKLLELLTGEHFAKESDKPNIKQFIIELVRTLSNMFDDLMEFNYFVKRAGTLLPEKTEDITEDSLLKTKQAFLQMRKDTYKKRLAADVEIKLRSFYFDRIERPAVVACIDSIYVHVKTLEDIEFFIKYFKSVLPPHPKDANGELIMANILVLQNELIQQRNGAIKSLSSAMSQLYPEQKPEDIDVKAAEIAILWQLERFANKKELNCMSQVTAEISKVFPIDYFSIDKEEIAQKAALLFSRK
jgi:hypothetical protein